MQVCHFRQVFYVLDNSSIFITDSDIKVNLDMYTSHITNGHLHYRHMKQHIVFASD